MSLPRTLALLVSLALAGPAQADEAYDACIKAADGTNAAWSACGKDLLQREDDRLNAVWKQVFSLTEGATRADLQDEQRAWNAYKDKSCLLYTSGEFGREGQALQFPACRAEVIAQRSKALQAFADFLKPQ